MSRRLPDEDTPSMTPWRSPGLFSMYRLGKCIERLSLVKRSIRGNAEIVSEDVAAGALRRALPAVRLQDVAGGGIDEGVSGAGGAVVPGDADVLLATLAHLQLGEGDEGTGARGDAMAVLGVHQLLNLGQPGLEGVFKVWSRSVVVWTAGSLHEAVMP